MQMQQMQIPQPPQLQQAAMMPHPNGIGMIPMATTTNPKLKCFSEGCNYVGTGICRWNNCYFRSKKRGGCERRYCHLHKFEKMQTIRTKHSSYVQHLSCCTECGEDFEADISSNKSCACYSLLICFLLIIPLMMLPLWMSMDSRGDDTDSYYNYRGSSW